MHAFIHADAMPAFHHGNPRVLALHRLRELRNALHREILIAENTLHKSGCERTVGTGQAQQASRGCTLHILKPGIAKCTLPCAQSVESAGFSSYLLGF
jgi:hypothetical protein